MCLGLKITSILVYVSLPCQYYAVVTNVKLILHEDMLVSELFKLFYIILIMAE